ncbi:MAG: hypothetical protein Q8P68_04135 [Candidatus Peregrinibacteria bacterium]|nr:hypothetical protein [Candidatus Peregrinibacteria bacterium]MDZ4245276.1 hypothetical protein [Candidatus Gracilibacteria bacterium]
MAFTVSQHLSQSFEMGKKTIPVYLKLTLMFLAYLAGGLLLMLVGTILPHPTVFMFIFTLLVFAMIIYLVVVNVQYKVALIKALEPVDKGVADAYKIWKDSKGNFWKKTVLTFVFMAAVLLGGILIVPGVLFLVWFSFCFFAAFLRDKKIFESMKYSKQVAKGHFWMIVGRAFVVMVIVVILFLPAQIFQAKLEPNVKQTLSNIEPDVEGLRGHDEQIQLTEQQFKGVFAGSGLAIVAYLFYVFVMGFLVMCFIYPYWYLLFKELETANKVK